MKFTIDRTKWICGTPSKNHRAHNCLGSGYTEMLNDKGFMCCLGQACKQLMGNENNLYGSNSPEVVARLNEEVIPFFTYRDLKSEIHDTAFTHDCISINDDKKTTVSEKERLLALEFEDAGHEIEFIN